MKTNINVAPPTPAPMAAPIPADRNFTFGFSLPEVAKQPVFWLGTAAIVFAYFSSNNQETQTGVHDALVIVAVGAGVAAIIYAARKS